MLFIVDDTHLAAMKLLILTSQAACPHLATFSITTSWTLYIQICWACPKHQSKMSDSVNIQIYVHSYVYL